MSPDNAWMALQGIETLPMRMEKHCENAMKVATHLSKHPKIEWVRYPGLSRDPMHRLQKTYLKGIGLCRIFLFVGCTRQFFTKSCLGDDAAVLAPSSGEEPALPRHRAGVASMAWRSTRRFRTNASRILISTQVKGDPWSSSASRAAARPARR